MTIPQKSEQPALRVGFVPGVTLTKWRTTWKQRFPRVPLEVVEVLPSDQRRVLDADEVDLCFVRLPLDVTGLHLIRLYEEIPVAWASKDHPLAAFDEVTLADLTGENVLYEADRASIELAAEGDAVLQVPQSVARSHSRRDLVYRPITDAPNTVVGLAWPVDLGNESIDEFIGVVRGRTANSSRSTQERTVGKEPKKQPKPPRPPTPVRARGRSGKRRS